MKNINIEINNTIYNITNGSDASDNDLIIKKSDPNDIWFHFENISSPHLILDKVDGKISKKDLKQIALLLFNYKKSAPTNTNVIYTEIKNVKLTKIPGSVNVKNTRIIKF